MPSVFHFSLWAREGSVCEPPVCAYLRCLRGSGRGRLYDAEALCQLKGNRKRTDVD